MDPFQSDAARATADRMKNPGARGPSPASQFAKWATAPIGLPNRMRTADQIRAGVQTPAPSGSGASPALPAWAQSQVAQGGGNPAHFQMEGSQLASARKPEEIQRDIQAHPPITTAPEQATPAPAPAIGVQATPPAQAQPAVQMMSRDPAREAMVAQFRHASQQARGGGQGQWVFPPGTGTDPVWMPNHAHDQAANYAQSLAQYDSGQAQRMQHDPASAIAKIDAINASPQRRATALAMGGMNGAEQAGLPDFGGGEIGGQATNEWLAAHKDQELGGVLGAVPQGVSPEARSALQRHIDSEYADPARWQAEASELPGLGDYSYGGPSFLSGPAKLFSYVMDRTPFGGQERNAKPGVFEAMRRIGLHSPPGTVNAGIPPQ